MLVTDSIWNIIDYKDLSEEERADLKSYFETYGTNKIIHMGDNRYSTYRQLIRGREPMDIRVAFGPNMFLYSRNIVAEYDYTIVIDEENEYKAVIRDEPTTYSHPYCDTGVLDLWFLDEYDCIILHDCNEFSVELCVSALDMWKGKRLILVGEKWEEMIPLLPDLPNLECFYEPVLSQERHFELSYGVKTLLITVGFPHQETLERYEQGIMTYDEIMALSFMFADYRVLGEANPDKHFFVMDAYYGNLGLFALFGKTECCARYVKSRGFIPVIRITKAKNSFYQNYEGDDVWAKFYCQPEVYSLEEVMHSKHVYFSPGFYDGSIMDEIMNRKSEGVALTWPNGKYNERVLSVLEERKKEFLPYPEKTLGVLARGTDYVKAAFHNHPIHANLEMICEKIDELRKQDTLYEYIYVSTEDAEYCEFFKKRYGEKCYFTDQERYITGKGESLTAHHKAAQKNRDGFLMGMDYILSIELLSKCRGMIASGSCAGVWEARNRNQGKYKDVFIFDLGTNV